jgi:hypothetical protein
VNYDNSRQQIINNDDALFGFPDHRDSESIHSVWPILDRDNIQNSVWWSVLSSHLVITVQSSATLSFSFVDELTSTDRTNGGAGIHSLTFSLCLRKCALFSDPLSHLERKLVFGETTLPFRRISCTEQTRQTQISQHGLFLPRYECSAVSVFLCHAAFPSWRGQATVVRLVCLLVR